MNRREEIIRLWFDMWLQKMIQVYPKYSLKMLFTRKAGDLNTTALPK